MVTDNPKNKVSFLISLPFFMLLWLILVLALISGISTWTSMPLFLLSTVLMFTHIIYAAYFIFKKAARFNFLNVLQAFLIYACLFILINNINRPLYWFFWLMVTFFLALAFHIYYKYKITDIYLKEFCNYKLYIETYGVISSLVGIALCLLFPAYIFFTGLLTILVIIKLNIFLFMKKKLYSVYYEPPQISEEPLITIVVIAYNEEQYIARLLESIKAQSYKKFEVIVVDDHSIDKTVEVARSFEPFLPIRVVQKEIRGVSRSRNFGASLANGEIILFLDADGIIPPDFISKNIRAFREQRLSVAGVDFIAITKNKIDKLITEFYRYWLKTVQYYNPRGIGFCLFAHKELHKKVLFDETVVMSEDFDYIRRASGYGKFRFLSDEPLEISWRRFENENRFILILKYLFFEWYRQHIGEIRRKLLPYEFGNLNSPKK